MKISDLSLVNVNGKAMHWFIPMHCTFVCTSCGGKCSLNFEADQNTKIPEICPFDCGTVNFRLHTIGD